MLTVVDPPAVTLWDATVVLALEISPAQTKYDPAGAYSVYEPLGAVTAVPEIRAPESACTTTPPTPIPPRVTVPVNAPGLVPIGMVKVVSPPATTVAVSVREVKPVDVQTTL